MTIKATVNEEQRINTVRLIVLSIALSLGTAAMAQDDGKDPGIAPQTPSSVMLLAQNAPAAPRAQTGNNAGDEDAPESEKIEEIFVAGSRIARKDYSSTSPVVTISVDDVEAFGATTVEETLRIMPQFGEGANAGTVAIGGGGGATLNMRALGSNRNLILLDRRRLPVATPFGDVDVNIVPTVMLKGVEVLTGGASSVYGSEAISGVVNFQSADFYDGAKVHASYGNAFDNGASVYDTSAMVSSEGLEGRGRGMIALGYTDRNPLRGENRNFFDFGIPSSFIGDGTFRSGGNGPNPAAVEALFASYGVAGVRTTDQLGFNDDGTLFTQTGALNFRGQTGDGTFLETIGGALRSPVGRQGTALKGLKRYTAFGKGEFDFTDTLTGYAQFMYSDSTTTGSASRNITLFGPTALIPVTNPFIPADLATLLATRADPNANFILNQRFLGIDERTHQESFITSQFLAGIKGDVGFKDWIFDLFAARDSVNATERIQPLLLGSRLNQLLQAPDGGASLCAGGYNPFGLANATGLSEECANFLAPGVTSTLDTRRLTVEGFITGALFALPAGDVSFSLSGAYREDKLDTNPALSIQTDDALGLTVSVPSSGKTETVEYGAELLVPILANAPMAQSLNLTGGIRVVDQDVSGSNESWSLGLEWRPVDSIFVRGGYARAVRSPNIGELFSSAIGGEATVGSPLQDPTAGDPCDIRTVERMGPNGDKVAAICIAQGLPPALIDEFQHTTTSLPTATGGNPNLDAEKADTYTFGMVWSPDLGNQGLNVTLDYWNIEIDDVIKTITGTNIVDRCFNASFNPTFDPNNLFCKLIVREGATGTVDQISTTFLNLATLKTSGIDLNVSHSIDIGGGTLSTAVAVGWVDEYKEQALPGEPFLDFVGTIGGPANRTVDNDIHPEWTVVVTPTYSYGPAALGFRWRHLSSMDPKETLTNPTATTPGVPSFDYFDIDGTYNLSEKVQLQASVRNVFDKNPPIVSGQTGQTRIGTYDVIGVSFNIGVTASF